MAPYPIAANSGGWQNVIEGQTALLLASSLSQLQGAVTATSSTQLWGVELNGLFFRLFDRSRFCLDALVGFLYDDLAETLKMQYISNGPAGGTFLEAILTDDFSVHNGIFAGQVGVQGKWTSKWVYCSFLAKVGLSGAEQKSEISGTFSDPLPTLYTSYGVGTSGGIFAQPSNSGRHIQNKFIVVPERIVRLGFNPTSQCSISVGYDILFFSNVLRPGQQIDQSINETQAGASGGGKTPTLTGVSEPALLMKNSCYWTQGINAGIQVQF